MAEKLQQITTKYFSNSVSIVSDTALRAFLCWVNDEVVEEWKIIKENIIREGVNIFPESPVIPKGKPITEIKQIIDEVLEVCSFSVFVLGSSYGEKYKELGNKSIQEYAFDVASKKVDKIFVWALPVEGKVLEGEQQEFIQKIQNSLARNIYLYTSDNRTSFLEDIKQYIKKRSEEEEEIRKEYDLVFISNILDAEPAFPVVETVEELWDITTLTVDPNIARAKEEGFRALKAEARRLIRKSRVAIIYFRDAAEWALSFCQLMWKEVKGLSSGTYFLLIGEDGPPRNKFLKFWAPGVVFDVLPKEEIIPTINRTVSKIMEGEVPPIEKRSPYPGLRPFKEEESIFFRGRDDNIEAILDILQEKHFVLVTGASGDGKSSLIYAGVFPHVKANFLPSLYTNWVIADMRPERSPLRNLANALAKHIREVSYDKILDRLNYGFSAIVDLYKESSLYVDLTSLEYLEASEQEKREMRKNAANLLILIDQFEEFFTNEENFRDGVPSLNSQITMNLLMETVRIAESEGLPIYVVFTMRSDFIGQCVAFHGLAEVIGQYSYFIPRLRRNSIQQVIEDPAIFNGDKIEFRLTQRLLNDVGEGIDQLPVLQHCLYQIWSLAQEEKRSLDIIHYAKVGGLAPYKLPPEERIEFEEWYEKLPDYKKQLFENPRLRNVLNRHANELYETLHIYYEEKYGQSINKEKAQYIVKRAFMCLTKIDEGRAVRNRMTLREIVEIIGQPNIDTQVVGRLLNIFREPENTLLYPYIQRDDPDTYELKPHDIVDITHEALIRNWNRLREWTEEEARSAQIFSELRLQVDQWLYHNKSPKYLLAVGPYTYFKEWFEKQQPTPRWILRYIAQEELSPDLPPLEQAEYYLEDIREFIEESGRRIGRNRRILLVLLGLVSFLLLLSLVAAYFAWEQKLIAEKQALIAEKQRILALENARKAENARLQAERALLVAEQQKLMAEQQRRIAEGERVRAEIQMKIAENEKLLAEYAKKIAENQTIIAENERRKAVAAKEEAEMSRKEALLQAEIAKIQRDNAYILQSLFLSYLSESQTNKGNAETAMLLALEGLPKDLENPERPYVEEAEGALYYALNAIENKEPLVTLKGHKNKVIYNQFSPDGKYLVSTSYDKTARLWDVKTGKEISVFKGHKHIVEKAVFSQDGTKILTLANDFTARLWDIKNSKLLQTFEGHLDELTSADISQDGKKIATSSMDATAIVFDAETGKKLYELKGHPSGVLNVKFSPDGKYIATSDETGEIRLWDAETGEQIKVLKKHTKKINALVFSPSGRFLAAASDDKTASIWHVRTGRFLRLLKGHKKAVLHLAFSPNEKKIVTASADATAKVWDVKRGRSLATLKDHKRKVYKVTFSPDGKFIATNSADNTARLWNAKTYIRIGIFKGIPADGYAVAFDPESKMLAMAGKHFYIVLYKLLPVGEDLIKYALAKKQRDLTEEEKEKFFLSDKRVRKEIIQQQLNRRLDRGYSKEEIELLPVPPNPEPPKFTPVPGWKPPKLDNVKNNSSPAFHVVQEGETIYSIAKKYNLAVEKLKQLNNLVSDEIYPGQKLKLR